MSRECLFINFVGFYALLGVQLRGLIGKLLLILYKILLPPSHIK